MIASRLRELVEERLVMIALPAADGAMAVAAAAGENAEDALGRPEIAQRSKTRAVCVRAQAYGALELRARRPEVDQEAARRSGVTSEMWRPALVLELADGEVIRIATPEVGALYELAEAVRSERK
jgi:hypothetical protein